MCYHGYENWLVFNYLRLLIWLVPNMNTQVNIHTCTYVHTYIVTYIHTYIHTCTYVHTYIVTYIHTYIHMYVCTYIHSYIHTHIRTYKLFPKGFQISDWYILFFRLSSLPWWWITRKKNCVHLLLGTSLE